MGRQGWGVARQHRQNNHATKAGGAVLVWVMSTILYRLDNTPLEGARVGLRKWLFAGYLLMTTRKGISSLQLSKELSVTQKNSVVYAPPATPCLR